jgi:hypothetical protein
VSASAGDSQATVTFTAPDSNGSAISGYTVTATDSTNPGNGGQSATGSGSPITVTGLTNGDAYIFTVTAANGNGNGAASAASSPVTPSGLPGSPTGVSASAGNGRATVTFTAPSDNGSAITGYTVTATDTTHAGHGGQSATGSGSPITVTGLTNGEAYTFTVKAANGNGTGTISVASNSVVPSSNTAVITSADMVTIAAGKALRFTVATSGTPAPTVTESGMPSWMTLKDGTNLLAGTAKLAGTAPATGGDYTFTLQANNGVGPDTLQSFTVRVLAITSSPAVTFVPGIAHTVVITTAGVSSGVTLSASVPVKLKGLKFHDNGNGTATLSGTAAATDVTTSVTVKATSGPVSAVQKLEVTIG